MRGVNISSHPGVPVPGSPTHTGTALVETATAVIQGFVPVNKIHQHLCAIHFYAHDMTRQVEAHHFSHEYEVKSGMLFMPGIVPGPIQHKDLEKLCKTYGKAIHFWQVDKGHNVPLGLPQVMMALTRDGQVFEGLAEDVERRFVVSFQEERKKRAYMREPTHGIHPLANGGGKGLKTVLREVDCKHVHSVPRVFA